MANEILGIDLGWASSVTVYQDRLVFAGSNVWPDLVMASRAGRYTDFSIASKTTTSNSETTIERVAVVPDPAPAGEVYETISEDAIRIRQTSASGNTFHAMLQQEGLFLLGDIGESVVHPGEFVPGAVQLRENSHYGSDPGKPPVIAGGKVVFLQRGGNDVRGMEWNEATRKYISESLITVSGQVFKNARDIAIRPSRDNFGETVYLVDGDGGMATMLLESGAPVPAWARWQTPLARIRAVAAPLGRMVFAIRRGNKVYMETLGKPGVDNRQESNYLDAYGEVGVYNSATHKVPEWMHGLEGVVVNGELRDIPEPGMGESDVEWTAVPGAGISEGDEIKYGVRYNREVITLPFVADAATGLKRSIRKVRIMDATVDLVLPQEDGETPRDLQLAARNDYRHLGLEVIAQFTQRPRPQPPRYLARQTPQLVTADFRALSGWIDRAALRISTWRHVEIAGVSYRGVG